MADELGWNRKRVCDWARRGLIPDTVKPTGTSGGPGKGYRFKKTPNLDAFIREYGSNTLAADAKLCSDRIGSIHPNRFDDVVAELERFSKLADKKLRTLINRRGFSTERARRVNEALAPILTVAFVIESANRNLDERIKANDQRRKKAKLASESFSASSDRRDAHMNHVKNIRKSLMSSGRKLS